MALPDGFISAAAGLVGAMIGGASTYLASRVQWRRESRRTVYANLISAAYEVESFITDGLAGAEGARIDSSTGIDLRTQFLSQLDSATLLAKWNTQGALIKWRELYPRIDSLGKLAEPNPAGLLDGWRKGRSEFYEFAKDELGVQGRLSYRRTIPVLLFMAALSMLIFVTLKSNEHGAGAVTDARYTLVYVSAALLFLTFRAAWRWRKRASAEFFHGKIDRLYIHMTVDILQVAIAVAFAFNVIAGLFEGSGVSVAFATIGVFVLFLGGWFQIIVGGRTLRSVVSGIRE